MSDLTPEEEGKLEQFREVTGYKDDEEDKVLRLLRVCHWNLDTACVRYFDNDFPTLIDDQVEVPEALRGLNDLNGIGGIGSMGRGYVTDEPMQRFGNNQPFMEFVPKLPRAMAIPNAWKFRVGLMTAQNNAQGPLLTPVVFILMIVPRLFWAIGWGLDKLLGPIFPNLFRFLGYREGPSDLPSHPVYATKEELSHYDISGYVNEILGEPTDLPIFKGEFNEAFNRSKAELRWLMVILINSDSDTSIKFVKNYLNGQDFIDFVKKYNVLVYVGDVLYPEPNEVGHVYKARTIPYVSLISNVSASGTTAASMSIVAKYQSFDQSKKLTPEGRKKFVSKLSRAIERYEPQLIVQRSEKQEADLSRVIKEQQDQAYEESLKKDMKKQEEKRKLADEAERKAEEERQQALLEEKRKRQTDALLAHYFQDKYVRDDSSWAKGDFTRIQLRNDQGQRVIKKFYKDDSTFDIFMIVKCKLYLEDQAQDAGISEEQALSNLVSHDFNGVDTTGFTPEFSFDLISPMPRLRLTPSKTTLVKDVKELWPNGSLLIEKLDETDDESDSD